MHSHDRTLLSKLGFSDPDKKDPKHDLACLFLREEATREMIGKWLLAQFPVLPEGAVGHHPKDVKIGRPVIEYHLQKGEGQYATTIGFLDVLYQPLINVCHIDKAQECDANWKPVGEPKLTRADEELRWLMFAEVKVHPVGVGDILRQMNLYSTYLHANSWRSRPAKFLPNGLVVTAWSPSRVERQAVTDAGFGWLTLGDRFQQWCAENATV